MSHALDVTDDPSSPDVRMNKEVFGVFGNRDDFDGVRDPDAFDAVVEGRGLTVGVRSPGLAVPGRAETHEAEDGICVLFGEVVPGGSAGGGSPVAGSETADPALKRDGGGVVRTRPAAPGPAAAPGPEGSPGDRTDVGVAARLLDRYARDGRAAFSHLNGSYLAAVEHRGEPVVTTDPLRSWECYYADVDGLRVFGSDVAALQALLADPGVDRPAVLEMLHLGTVLGDRTLFDAVSRVPFDGYLTPTTAGELDRFVYDPREFDHVAELAARLERAIDRRAHYPGTEGLLLSAGKDSRLFLSRLPGIEHTYTVGRRDSREVRVARAIARQYDATHRAFEPGDAYLYPSPEKVLYSGAVKETLHIHHGGFDDRFEADVMYHGLLFDTLFKGYFLEWDGLSLLGRKLESDRLVGDPDPVDSLLDTLGFLPTASRRLQDRLGDLVDGLDLDVGAPRVFLEDRFRAELQRCWERADSVHNAMDLLVIRNQPVMPFHTHLADNFREAFVAMDPELRAWHRHAPPGKRNGETFRRAIERIDDDILRHRPPNQPHASRYLNQVERLVRRLVPGLEAFEPAWPDRREVYDEQDLDERLFPGSPAVHDLPARQKLRLNDVRWWLS